MGEAYGTYGGIKIYKKLWQGNMKEQRPPRRYRHDWKNNIEMTPKELVCEGLRWVYVDHNRDKSQAVVNTVRNVRFVTDTY
jgi:hypothetical protein